MNHSPDIQPNSHTSVLRIVGSGALFALLTPFIWAVIGGVYHAVLGSVVPSIRVSQNEGGLVLMATCLAPIVGFIGGVAAAFVRQDIGLTKRWLVLALAMAGLVCALHTAIVLAGGYPNFSLV